MADEFMKAALYGIKTFNKKAKEKIGMMKLIELLNEYERERVNHSMIDFIPYGEKSFNDLSVAQVISKKYGFIKWLVDNDKIDKKKLDEAERKPMYVTDDMFSLYKVDECVIMLLSISDTPIDDLISYLR